MRGSISVRLPVRRSVTIGVRRGEQGPQPTTHRFVVELTDAASQSARRRLSIAIRDREGGQ